MVVTFTEFENIPYAEATHLSLILLHLPLAWRNQYDLTHKTVPESPRAMLLDFENIEKLFANRYNEKARANKAKAATASKTAERMPKKRAHEGGSKEEPPQKAVLPSSRPTIPSSVAGSQRTLALRTSLLSPSIPQRSTGKRQVAEIPVRWPI